MHKRSIVSSLSPSNKSQLLNCVLDALLNLVNFWYCRDVFSLILSGVQSGSKVWHQTGYSISPKNVSRLISRTRLHKLCTFFFCSFMFCRSTCGTGIVSKRSYTHHTSRNLNQRENHTISEMRLKRLLSHNDGVYPWKKLFLIQTILGQLPVEVRLHYLGMYNILIHKRNDHQQRFLRLICR